MLWKTTLAVGSRAPAAAGSSLSWVQVQDGGGLAWGEGRAGEQGGEATSLVGAGGQGEGVAELGVLRLRYAGPAVVTHCTDPGGKTMNRHGKGNRRRQVDGWSGSQERDAWLNLGMKARAVPWAARWASEKRTSLGVGREGADLRSWDQERGTVDAPGSLSVRPCLLPVTESSPITFWKLDALLVGVVGAMPPPCVLLCKCRQWMCPGAETCPGRPHPLSGWGWGGGVSWVAFQSVCFPGPACPELSLAPVSLPQLCVPGHVPLLAAVPGVHLSCWLGLSLPPSSVSAWLCLVLYFCFPVCL